MKQTEILTHATHVNGWFPAVYMSCMSQNFRLFHVSNLSVRNFRIFLLMYTGSLTPTAAAAAETPAFPALFDLTTYIITTRTRAESDLSLFSCIYVTQTACQCDLVHAKRLIRRMHSHGFRKHCETLQSSAGRYV